MMEHDNGIKKECIPVCVTGSPCCTVEKKLYWGNNNLKKSYYPIALPYIFFLGKISQPFWQKVEEFLYNQVKLTGIFNV